MFLHLGPLHMLVPLPGKEFPRFSLLCLIQLHSPVLVKCHLFWENLSPPILWAAGPCNPSSAAWGSLHLPQFVSCLFVYLIVHCLSLPLHCKIGDFGIHPASLPPRTIIYIEQVLNICQLNHSESLMKILNQKQVRAMTSALIPACMSGSDFYPQDCLFGGGE